MFVFKVARILIKSALSGISLAKKLTVKYILIRIHSLENIGLYYYYFNRCFIGN